MGVFGRRAPTTTLAPPRRAPIKVLRADGQRIDLTRRDTGQLLSATRQAWQSQAWAYRDLIGELRFAVQQRSRAVARVRYYPAVIRPWPEDPVPLDAKDTGLSAQLIADAKASFERIPFDASPDGFTARLDENFYVAGEGWIHIDPDEQFAVRSTSEITPSSSGLVQISTLPSGGAGAQRPIDPNTEDLLRCWSPHPEWGQLADSPMRALLDVCEDIVLTGRELRAAARSRIAANGILLLSSGMSLSRTRDDEDEAFDDSITSDTFMADFTAAMLAPIRDDGDPQAVVPIVLRGDPEDLAAVKHLTMERADAEKLIDRQGASLMRLLKGLDVQPEQVEGIGGMNHWGAWIIDSRAIRDQVEPAAETIAAALAAAYLRPSLKALDYSDAEVGQFTIAVDTSPLSENPDRGQDARDAWDRFAITDAALREALGFSEEDAPDAKEFLRRLAAKGGLPVADIAQMVGLRPEDNGVAAPGQSPALPAALPSIDAPAAQPGQVVPTNPVPAKPTSTPPAAAPIIAAGEPDPYALRVDADASRRLADIDSALTERIAVAADAALNRVLERAGARVRSAAQKDRAVAGRIGAMDAHLIPAALGRDLVEQFVPVADLLADGYTRLRGQVDGWLRDAAQLTGLVVCDILGLASDSRRGHEVQATVVSRLQPERAWPVLAAALDQAGHDALFAVATSDPDEEGEHTDGLISALDVIEALAAAGGDAPSLTSAGDPNRRPAKARRPRITVGSGYATGTFVRHVIGEHGGVQLGWEWQYRPELVRRTFPPHHALDGERFPTFTDPKLDTGAKTAWLGDRFRPQDHKGCRCTASPIFAVPDDPEGVVARRLREAAGNPRNIAASRLADEDTAAGRTGTSVQNTTEVRQRITAAVDAMRAEHIDRPRRKR